MNRTNIGLRIFGGSDRSADFNAWHTEDFVFYQHPNYIPETIDSDRNSTEYLNQKQFDIAIIILKTAIDWDKYGKKEGVKEFMLNTICLPKSEVVPFSDNYPFERATLYGWGYKADAEPAWILQRGDFWVRHEIEHERFFFYGIGINEPKSAIVS